MNLPVLIESFVVRFTGEQFQDASGEKRIRWRGNIVHVSGDKKQSFTDFSEAAAFIESYLNENVNTTPNVGEK